MKSKFKLLVLLLCFVLCVSMLAACGGETKPDDEETPEEDNWVPTGEEITLIKAGDSMKYVIVYSSSNTVSMGSATELRSQLNTMGFRVAPNIVPDTQTHDYEIIFGETNRKVSKDAMAYLEEVSKATPNDLHWVFHYRNGKLAIVANSQEAYAKAVINFLDTYIKGSSIVFKDDLKAEGVMTRLAYNEELAEQERLEAEKQEAIHQEQIRLIKEEYEAQRERIKADNTIFGKATKNIGASQWGTISATPSSDHPRLLINSDTIELVKAALADKNDTNNVQFDVLLKSTVSDNAKLPAATERDWNTTVNKGNKYNYNESILGNIQVKALGYLLYEDELYGYQAIVWLKNYIETLDIQYIASDQCRQYGYVMFTAAIVYDWCYDLLTEEDKNQIVAAVEHKLCRGSNEAGAKMEVGFPPEGQGSVSGHGSEYQILRDYLSFAVAIYDENASWWNYVAPRVYNDYVAVRNVYFQSGVAQQGTGYATARHICDLYSAWILKAATGSEPYVGMDKTLRSFLGYEYAPNKLFNDGDGSGDSKATSSFMSMMFLSAYLYDDATLLAQAEHYLDDDDVGTDRGFPLAVYLALRGMSEVEPADDKYEGMDLIQYNGSPLGQYIIREAWNDANSAAVFMRIKERTTANHEHGDSGTFEIYYKGMLTSDGGCYNNYSHAQTAYFHRSTISHNGLIIFNPSEYDANSSTASKKWYSGSQTIPSEAKKLSTWQTETYDRGTVTGRQHAYSDAAETTPLYAYIAGDITKAYDSATVNYVGRRMLTVYTGDESYPMVFFVYDDIESDKAEYEKRFLLQISSDVEPTVNGNTVITEHDGGRLVLTSLSEDLGNAVVINKCGGRVYTSAGKLDAVKSMNYQINGVQCVPQSTTADDGHWGRIEIVSDENSKKAQFMNVLYVTDAGNTATVPVRSVDGDGMVGGVFNNKIVALFATSRTRATEELAANVSGSGTRSYYISGVAAGDWEVTVNGTSVGTVTATEEGGLLTFDAPAGDVVINRK